MSVCCRSIAHRRLLFSVAYFYYFLSFLFELLIRSFEKATKQSAAAAAAAHFFFFFLCMYRKEWNANLTYYDGAN